MRHPGARPRVVADELGAEAGLALALPGEKREVEPQLAHLRGDVQGRRADVPSVDAHVRESERFGSTSGQVALRVVDGEPAQGPRPVAVVSIDALRVRVAFLVHHAVASPEDAFAEAAGRVRNEQLHAVVRGDVDAPLGVALGAVGRRVDCLRELGGREDVRIARVLDVDADDAAARAARPEHGAPLAIRKQGKAEQVRVRQARL